MSGVCWTFKHDKNKTHPTDYEMANHLLFFLHISLLQVDITFFDFYHINMALAVKHRLSWSVLKTIDSKFHSY